jgi:hypothetical protein
MNIFTEAATEMSAGQKAAFIIPGIILILLSFVAGYFAFKM